MKKKKMTTPFDEAMDGIATAIWYLKEHGKIVKEDIDGSCFEKDGELTMDTIKSSFIEGATIIPDGWDVIKKGIKEESLRMEHIDERMASLVLQKLCKKYGIEVDDE